MKKLVLIIPLILVFSCRNSTNNSDCYVEICSNANKLISKFDTIPTIDSDLIELKGDIREKVESFLQPKHANEYLYFNVKQNCDSLTSRKLSISFYFSEENPTRLVTIYRFPLTLNTKGDVLFGPDIIDLDSLSTKIYNHYQGIGTPEFPDSYDKNKFTLAWDLGVDEKDFNKYIDQIIEGYLMFIELQCTAQFGKGLCQLARTELDIIAKEYPFMLYIEDYETIDVL